MTSDEEAPVWRRTGVRVRREIVARGHLVGARVIGRPRFRDRPLLLMGTARSGTSFVGAVLARAPEIAYLREPVTHEIFRRFAATPLVSRFHEDPPPDALVELADRAFLGRLPTNPRVTIHPRDAWSSRVMARLVKEVQPLASRWLVDRYDARYVALLRHPGAIAASWWGRGWGPAVHESIFADRFQRIGIGTDPAERLGAIIAAHEHAMFAVVAARPDAVCVTYEDVARDPTGVMEGLYRDLGLTWTPGIATHVAAITDGRAVVDAPAHLVRRARDRATAWRADVDAEVAGALRRGYELGGGTAYLDQW